MRRPEYAIVENVIMSKKDKKTRADFFNSAEQKLLVELYEEYRNAITRKRNTVAIVKARDMAWQKIADRLNAYVNFYINV